MALIRRAVVSVSDKTGVVDFVRNLVEMGVEILSTGGTRWILKDSGLEVMDVSEYTAFPEMMDGRVKTLHPKIHGGILGRRDNPKDRGEMEAHGINPIDMVIVNLYPFEKVCEDSSIPDEELPEYIDIGGVALLRAAAKNFADVVTVCDPNDYKMVLEELKENGGIKEELRKKLAVKAFMHTSNYDAVIAKTFKAKLNDSSFPEVTTLG